MIKMVDITEKELENLICTHPNHLEEGMKTISHQVKMGLDALDVLMVDDEGALAIVELKNEIHDSESPLLQALKYYDWCSKNIAWITDAYKLFKIDAQKDIRLILVAPGFSESLKRLATYLGIEVELFKYQAIEEQDGKKDLICNQDSYSNRPKVLSIPTLQKSIDRIKVKEARELFEECLKQLQNKYGIELQPRASDRVSGFYNGSRILRLYPKDAFFSIRLLETSGLWTNRIRVNDKSAWQTFLVNKLEHVLPSSPQSSVAL